MTRPRSHRHDQVQQRVAALAGAGAARGIRAAAADTAAEGDAAPQVTAELWLYGVVGGWWFGFDSDDVAYQLRRLGDEVTHLRVRLHSPGGNALEGIAIGNLLRNHPATVQVVVDGLAASAASVIALAGDEVVMSPGAQLMIHDPWMLAIGNEAELRSEADFLGKQAQNYAGVYAYAAAGTAEQWRQVMLAETWYTADEAVAAGLADRVGTIASTSTPPAPPEPDGDDDGELDARAAWDLDVLVHPAARAAWRATPRGSRGGARSGTRGNCSPKPPNASADGSHNTEGGPAVAFSDEQLTTLRSTLELEDSADEAAIVAAVSAVVEDSVADTATDPAAAAQVPEGMVLVESAVLDGLRSGAQAGRDAVDRFARQDRDTAINAAIASGKTTPARREHWEKAFKADPEGAKAQLDALEAGLVPVVEQGHSGEPEEGGVALTLSEVRESDDYKNWSI